MRRCAGIKRDGGRCTVTVDGAEQYCHHHNPTRAEARKRAASRAAKSKPTSLEITALKGELHDVKTAVREGDIDRKDAVAIVQIVRAIGQLIELDRRVKETDQLAADIEDLKKAYGMHGGHGAA